MRDDPLSATFAALADPTRRAILARLAEGEATVGQLAEPFQVSLPAISKHLKVLERAGLVSRGRHAQWRPCRLEAAPLRAVAEWTLGYRRFWTESLERLDEYLREVQAGTGTPTAAGASQGRAEVTGREPGDADGHGGRGAAGAGRDEGGGGGNGRRAGRRDAGPVGEQ